jgi:uncharacterized protein (DUF1501 family)
MNRRHFLRQSASLGAMTALGGGLSVATVDDAHAQSDYKAMVCIFLFGGNDGFNTLIPIDTARFSAYTGIRKQVAIPRAALTQISDEWALHPAASALKEVWDAGALANILNVGTLAQPMTQAQYFDLRDSTDYSKIPLNLFSHSDQQNLWEIGASNGTSLQTGWGGRLVDAAGLGSLYSFAGSPKFGVSARSSILALPGPGSGFGLNGRGDNVWDKAIVEALNTLVASPGGDLQNAYAKTLRSGMDLGTRLGPLLKQAPATGGADTANPEISAAFNNLAGNSRYELSRQLYQVAKLIKNRSTLGGNRQIFFVSRGGFDNHSNQVASNPAEGDHARLLQDVSAAMASFYKATVALGVAPQVTSFTMSDFGRTLKPNSTYGTDHAWGNIHFAMGGSVIGKTSYGRYPELVLGGADDAGKDPWEHQGRFIPGISVEQYASTLINWFTPGVDRAAMFPNLKNFTNAKFGWDIGFLKAAS